VSAYASGNTGQYVSSDDFTENFIKASASDAEKK